MKRLQDYAKNRYYSQYGEDGIVEEILNRLSSHVKLDNWCSEFGAWDGRHLSNACYFIKKKNYNSVLIEGDSKRVLQLKKNFPQNDVIKVQRFVSFDGKNSLDCIFDEYIIPRDFDFLSIDVDGVDYHVFDSLRKYRPKIICVEFNPTIPNAVDYVQPRDMSIKHGSSARALLRLALEKDYELATSTHCNLIFVDKALIRYVVTEVPSLEDENQQGNDPIFMFQAYDGTLLSNKDSITIPWHGLDVPFAKIQFLPKVFRKFYGDFGLLRKLAFFGYMGLRMPGLFFSKKSRVLDRLKKDLK